MSIVHRFRSYPTVSMLHIIRSVSSRCKLRAILAAGMPSTVLSTWVVSGLDFASAMSCWTVMDRVLLVQYLNTVAVDFIFYSLLSVWATDTKLGNVIIQLMKMLLMFTSYPATSFSLSSMSQCRCLLLVDLCRKYFLHFLTCWAPQVKFHAVTLFEKKKQTSLHLISKKHIYTRHQDKETGLQGGGGRKQEDSGWTIPLTKSFAKCNKPFLIMTMGVIWSDLIVI